MQFAVDLKRGLYRAVLCGVNLGLVDGIRADVAARAAGSIA